MENIKKENEIFNEEFLINFTDNKLIKPFLKWAGGKLRVVDRLKKHFPKDAKRYIEPFLGAGSVALNVQYSEYIINDTNTDLISVWKYFQKNGNKFVEACKTLFEPENNTAEKYYELRTEFNTTKDKLRKSLLFIYLNRHCFNGLCRYNSSGEYNAPKGDYEIPYFPQKEFDNSLEQIKKFKIYNKDFREIFDMVKDGDLVYCDPPYFPMSESANFNAYAEGGFGLQEQWDLATCAAKAADKGAVVVVSNNYNWYSKELYNKIHKAKIQKIEVSRTISSKIDKRNAVSEIIAIFNKY